MERYIGTTARGIRTPIIQSGDDLINITFDSVTKALASEGIEMRDRDIVCITESLLARAQGNFATLEQVSKDIKSKYVDEIGLVFPLLSRNRFLSILQAVEMTGLKVYILLSYPSDEVGNQLMDESSLYGKDINPYTDTLSEAEYRKIVGDTYAHGFTSVDYVQLYKDTVTGVEIHFSNYPTTILNYTKDVLVCNIHRRHRVKEELKEAGANRVYGLDDILNSPVDGSGFNEDYGILGCNLSDHNKIKLFPRDGQPFVEALQKKFMEECDRDIEVMIYGDGAFKDPQGMIWELADPVVSPAFTSGLEGTPDELKMKFLADTELSHLDAAEAHKALLEKIAQHNESNVKHKEASVGTTPRQLTDLVGSLADLISGSGDKGTPVVYVQGYFDDFSDN